MRDKFVIVLFAFNVLAVTMLTVWAYFDNPVPRAAMRLVLLYALTVLGPMWLAWQWRSWRPLGMGIAALAIAQALLE